ncbi:hypothetical protein KI688_007284 [Linnemannia hyalina]|uniref:RNI-like protein n=1 Tax=Linnemannia hyalina TaxID=64524 RepID=A0A9P7XKS9_9FUNG|nr:hypothetical protein KI688_007284 [Linnemannia hyalina]
MEETQSFRITGTTDVKNIDVDIVSGQNVIYWEDINQVFPRVGHVCNGSSIVKLLRDSSRIRIVPHCIKHCPGVVLDVVLSTNEHAHVDPPMATLGLAPDTPTHPYHPGAIINELNVNPPASSTATLAEFVSSLAIAAESSTDLSSAEPRQATVTRGNTTHIQSQFISVAAVIEHARQSGKPLTSEALSSLIASKLTPASMAKSGFERTVIHKLDGLHDQGAMTQQIAREVWELQKQMNDRLVLIQSKTEAILTQQLELAEYPIPRLFIVLPEVPAKYDPGNWFRTKFRLHFICECGKHTDVNNSKDPHHLHLAKHEGYLIREPTEFFKKYGPFLLLMLELIKFGTSIAGHVVPTLASLKVVELADSVKQSVELVTAKIDYSLECIDKQLAKVQASSPEDHIDTEPGAAMTQHDLTNYLSDVEGLEGIELRQLRSFLKTSEEENLLGNLYRMTTPDGHVKWVCYDHYRASYQEKHTQKLRSVVQMAQGEFDEQLGRIIITLTSSIVAAEFYDAVSKAKGILGLTVDMSWECIRSDLEALENALKQSRISILRLNLRQFRTSLGSKLLSTSAQCELSFELAALSIGGKEFGRLAETLKTNSTLTTLNLRDNSIGDNGAQALSAALKINSTLTILDLGHNSIGDNGAQALSEALNTNSTLTTLNLYINSITDNGAKALSEALKTNSTLTTLNLGHNSIRENGVKALAEALKTNSTLTTLNLYTNWIGVNGVQALSEALEINSTLTTLDLAYSGIGENGVKALAEALKTNSTLTTLNLGHNSIGDNGAQALSEALKTNSTLTTLKLYTNSIGDNGVQALSEALEINSTLTTLHLGYNSIRPNGAQALAEALKTNSTLTTLDLTNNSIGDNGVQALAEALKTNSTLTTLKLYTNSIGDNGAQALALKTNSTATIIT